MLLFQIFIDVCPLILLRNQLQRNRKFLSHDLIAQVIDYLNCEIDFSSDEVSIICPYSKLIRIIIHINNVGDLCLRERV